MDEIRSKVIDARVAVNAALGILNLLTTHNWIRYSEKDSQIIFDDLREHLYASYVLLEKEISRTADVWEKSSKKRVPSNKKVNLKNINKAIAEMEKAKALWEMLLRYDHLFEDDESKSYFPKTGFYVITEELFLAVKVFSHENPKKDE